MHNRTPLAESTGNAPALDLALELGAAKWVVIFGTTMLGGRRRRTLVIASSQTVGVTLREAIAEAKRAFGLGAAVPVRSCSEAGRDGFWVHRLLAMLGVENCVIERCPLLASVHGEK